MAQKLNTPHTSLFCGSPNFGDISRHLEIYLRTATGCVNVAHPLFDAGEDDPEAADYGPRQHYQKLGHWKARDLEIGKRGATNTSRVHGCVSDLYSSFMTWQCG